MIKYKVPLVRAVEVVGWLTHACMQFTSRQARSQRGSVRSIDPPPCPKMSTFPPNANILNIVCQWINEIA